MDWLEQAECASSAATFCDKGFGYAGAWNKDPAGCFVDATAKSECTVYFNTLTTSSPSTTYRWKICVKSRCSDSAYAIDQKGYKCHHWVGYDCRRAAEDWGYTQAGENYLRQNCAFTCTAGRCEDSSRRRRRRRRRL